MNLLLDALSVVRNESPTVLLLFAALVWGSVVLAGVLGHALGAGSSGAQLFSLALGGWMVPAFLCSVVLLPLGIFLRVRPSTLAVVAFALVTAGWGIWSIGRRRQAHSAASIALSLLLAAFFLVIAVLRLAFLAQTPLPLYFDSAEHYRIIHELMTDYAATSTAVPVTSPVDSYYHLGYHGVMAVLAVISQANLGRLMLVSGVIALAALPIPLFVIPYHATGSKSAGLLAVLLGTLGWYMPGHVLNWGKYPAVFVVPVLLFTLDAAYLGGLADQNFRSRRGLRILAVVGACVAAAIQTRSVVLIAVVLAAWVGSGLWQRRPAAQRFLAASLMIAALISEVLLLGRSPVLSPVLDPYLGSGVWITALVGVLAAFAFAGFPRLAFACLLSVVLLILGLFIPGPDFASGPLLDRPLVEMLLFAPLAVLGATGFAAMIRQLHVRNGLIHAIPAALIYIVIIAYAAGHYSFYPSACCRMVDSDDLAALDWLSRTPATDSRVLIPTAAMSDAPLPYPPLLPASDAGAWVLPLTGRRVSSLPYWTDFGDPKTLETLCQQRVGEIFVSSGSQSFSGPSLQAKPEWYIVALELPQTSIYTVAACDR